MVSKSKKWTPKEQKSTLSIVILPIDYYIYILDYKVIIKLIIIINTVYVAGATFCNQQNTIFCHSNLSWVRGISSSSDLFIFKSCSCPSTDFSQVSFGRPRVFLYESIAYFNAFLAGVSSSSWHTCPNQTNLRTPIIIDHGLTWVIRYTSVFEIFLGYFMWSTYIKLNKTKNQAEKLRK